MESSSRAVRAARVMLRSRSALALPVRLLGSQYSDSPA